MLRQIVEEKAVSDTIDSYSSIDRLDEDWEGLKWLLSRSADKLAHPLFKGHGNFYLYKKKGLADLPDIVVLYSYDDSTVYLHSIRITMDEEAVLHDIKEEVSA